MTDYIPTEDVEAPISANFVTAPGFERAQLTVRANDVQQYTERLAALTGRPELALMDALEATVEFDKLLKEKAGAAPSSAPAAATTGSPSRSNQQARTAPQGAAPQSQSGGHDGTPHPEGIACSAVNCNGSVVGKTIKSAKNGRTYDMWVCPNQRTRNDGHFSEFVN